MTHGVDTWNALAPADGNVLLIVNSSDGDTAPVEAAVDRVLALVPVERVYAISSVSWRSWLAERGIDGNRLLVALDSEGKPYDISFFLNLPVTLRWVHSRAHALVLGTVPHNLYNEEIQDVFERRVALLLGGGAFIAHTLPNEFVYVLRLADLLRRFGRESARRRYVSVAQAMVDELAQKWIEQGRPPVADTPNTEAMAIMRRHLPEGVKNFDENHPVAMESDNVDSIAEYVRELQATLVDASRSVIDAGRSVIQSTEAANHMTGIVKELQVAVDTRDRIIEQLRAEQDRLTRGWRRLVVGRARVSSGG
jgi:hypothetical protein